MKVLTKEFFKEHPEANWEWHYDFIKLSANCETNPGHNAIKEFQEYCLHSQKTKK